MRMWFLPLPRVPASCESLHELRVRVHSTDTEEVTCHTPKCPSFKCICLGHYLWQLVPLTDRHRDGVTSIYSMLNLRKDDILIDDYEDPPITSAPAEMPVTAQGGAHEQEPKEYIGNRPYRKIYLLCIITCILAVIVAGLSIHVSQIRQSMITSDRNYRELISHLNLSQRTCLKNLSTLNSDLIDLNRTHTDLRHQFTDMETKYRSVNETKAQICELLTSRREHTCSKDWITNKDRCYFVSTSETFFPTAMQECSNRDARLLEINSRDEASFVSNKLVYRNSAYWIGKCEDGNVDWDLLYKVSSGTSD
ncbi:oxidized low-density lipoprotein receptor 1-like [Mobula birostris]|uniref:oxidized low-density lipoprotein receptor 1-like n=1 Tax=Mobula birostris TaxID=1983395 RepID=UPI003B28BA6D